MTSVKARPRQLFVVVERGSAGMRMRLVPLFPNGERVAAANQDLGILPLELIGDGDRDSLTEVYHVFRRLDLPASSAHDDDRQAAVFARWEAALAASGIRLRLERRALYGFPLPRTAWQSDARGISMRPWDIELTALEARLRSIVKLDRIPAEYVEDLKQRAQQRGLVTGVVTPDDANRDSSVTLIVANETASLAEGRDLEQRLLVRGGDPRAEGAASWMGELLGYPRCCVERFARVAEQNDTTLAWALLPEARTPQSPLTQWLQPGLALLSHSPCELSCAASIALGQRLLDALDAKDHGFAARWRSYTARVQVVDRDGHRLALAVDGTLQAGGKVNAADWLQSGGPDPDAPEWAQRLIGMEVRLESGGLVTDECDWYAPYVADHRGEA